MKREATKSEGANTQPTALRDGTAPSQPGCGETLLPPVATISGRTKQSPVLCLQKQIRILNSSSGGNGGRSSMVEPQIVILVVAGSSPVGHPASQVPNPKFQAPNLNLRIGIWCLDFGFLRRVPVAQPDRASDFGSEGWGFESLQARI